MLLVSFVTSPHETKVQHICISNDNDNNKNENRVYIYEFENSVRCKLSAVLMLRIQVFWVIMLSSRALIDFRCSEGMTQKL